MLLLLAAGAVLNTGCVVTNTIDFVPEENFPPSLQAVPSSPGRPGLNEIIVLETDNPGVALEVDVDVVDPNLDQELTWIVLLNESSLASMGTIEPTGTLTRRLSFTVDLLPLDVGLGECVSLELRVSSQFNAFTPLIPGDLGSALWWVLRPDDEGNVDPTLCPGSLTI
jgi:hypothetical protein